MQVISGVNNSAFFAQSAYSASTASYDVNGYPITSYLPESGVGYNAVNEVSALNGSAIAQYGAEKQWLVTDDTLVHLSNSAQFALGVNLSAVAQLLNIDRTVLFDSVYLSNHTSAATLSEPLSSFDRIEVRMVRGDTNYTECPTVLYFEPRATLNNVQVNWSLGQNGWYIVNQKLTWDDEHLYVTSAHSIQGTSFATGTINQESNTLLLRNTIIKVVGIGRKQ